MDNLGTLVISSKKLKISMDNKLVKWNTGRLIDKELNSLKFFENYEIINKDLYDMYWHLVKYKRSNYNGNAAINYGSDLYDSLIQHLDNMVTFQKLVDSGDPTVNLAEEAKARFDNKDVRNTLAIDRQEIARLELLLEYASSVRFLFNNVLPLINRSETVSLELSNELEEVLRNKGLDNFAIPEELLISQTVTQTV
jgi:hypothetical protein